MTQEKYRFDLSDGFGKEDIYAIFAGIWNIIGFILKLIFYPYVWILRMFGRSFRFARTRKSPEKPLEPEERSFVESIPGFFVLVGFFGGLLFAVVVWLTDETRLGEFLDNINVTSIIEALGAFFGGVIEIILLIIGVDDRSVDPVRDRFGLLDIIFDVIYDGILVNIISVVTDEPILTFIGIGLIGVVLAIAWIIISETGIVGGIFSFLSRIFSTAVAVPSNAWNRSNRIYLKFNHAIASIIIGQNRLDERNIGFHRKIMLLTFGLGIYTFLAGIAVGVTTPQDVLDPIPYIFAVILGLGLGVGLVEMFLIVRILDIVSRNKYLPKQTEM